MKGVPERPEAAADARPPPSFGEAFVTWLRIGVLSFGGPTGQIALMHRIVVDEKGWLGETAYLEALGFCMLLPGPEAMQLATYAGWRLHGVRGGLAAGLSFVLPGAAVVLALAMIYAAFGAQPLVAAVFLGVKAAVLVILDLALWFALHVFFAEVAARHVGPLRLWTPTAASLDWRVAALALVSGVLLLRLRWSILRVLAVAAALALLPRLGGP